MIIICTEWDSKNCVVFMQNKLMTTSGSKGSKFFKERGLHTETAHPRRVCNIPLVSANS